MSLATHAVAVAAVLKFPTVAVVVEEAVCLHRYTVEL